VQVIGTQGVSIPKSSDINFANIDSQFQKELVLVREYLIQGKDVDVTFTSYLTKK